MSRAALLLGILRPRCSPSSAPICFELHSACSIGALDVIYSTMNSYTSRACRNLIDGRPRIYLGSFTKWRCPTVFCKSQAPLRPDPSHPQPHQDNKSARTLIVNGASGFRNFMTFPAARRRAIPRWSFRSALAATTCSSWKRVKLKEQQHMHMVALFSAEMRPARIGTTSTCRSRLQHAAPASGDSSWFAPRPSGSGCCFVLPFGRRALQKDTKRPFVACIVNYAVLACLL